MRCRMSAIAVSSAAAMLALTQASLAAGPSLPALDGGTGLTAPGADVTYLTRLAASTTSLQLRAHGHTIRRVTLAGGWGIQLATLGGTLTGLSPKGRVLVLSDNVHPDGSLRARSRFAVIDTRTLTLTQTIRLRGDFSVDALSPDGRLLYLIHHIPSIDATKYQVQAYDLHDHRLLPGVIADKRQAGWIMAGYPITRTTTRSGSWVYTLYSQTDNYPFIHALDTAHHVAVCVGLPAKWTTDSAWISNAHLKLTAGMLIVATGTGKTRFLLNTKTFRVTTPESR